ncbi:MAG: polysaccharide deacetylase family protein [Patescibacteria group bacterium]|nr:polysaccharide deacetylase family protein [Patescibacteria group bacterium]
MKKFTVVTIAVIATLGFLSLAGCQKNQNTQEDNSSQKKVEIQVGEGIIKFNDPYTNITTSLDFDGKQAQVKYGANTADYTIKDVLQPFNIDNVSGLEYPFLMEADYSDGKKVEYLVIAHTDGDHLVAVDQVAVGHPSRIDEIHPYNNREIVVECYIGVGADKEMVNLDYTFSNDKIVPGKDNIDINSANPAPKETPKPSSTSTAASSPKATTTTQKVANKGKVALTFDDGPGRYTTGMLNTLKDKGVKATFYVIGENAESKPEVVAREFNEGNEVGNHTYTHPDLKKLTADAQSDEIGKNNKTIKNIIPTLIPIWFRPPYGNYNDDTLNILPKLGLNKVLWTVDTRDWSGKSADDITSAALDGAKDGAIILMHDGVANSVETAKALPNIIDGLRNRGYQMVTVTELNKK